MLYRKQKYFKSNEEKANTVRLLKPNEETAKIRDEHKEILKNEIYYFLDFSSKIRSGIYHLGYLKIDWT